MTFINRHIDTLYPGSSLAAPYTAEMSMPGAVLHVQYPATEIGDLQFARMSLVAQRETLLGVYHPRQVTFAERVAERKLGVLLGRWEDPTGDADQILEAMLQDCITNREQEKATVAVKYRPDDTLPPDAYNGIEAINGNICEIEDLLVGRREHPAPKSQRISPYWLGPVRRAVMLQAQTAEDAITRAAAQDLAERRLILSTHHMQRHLRAVNRAAHTALRSLTGWMME